MADKKVPTCGDCIHADVCERNPLYTEFSRDNPAYCEEFKDKSKLVEVVRCKECNNWFCHEINGRKILGRCCHFGRAVRADDFCSYGERRTDNG